jgi:hypothetical protein
MRKYIFIKDELHPSTLHSNYIEYLAKDDDLQCEISASQIYKIKLMPTAEAKSLVGKHARLLNPDMTSFDDTHPLTLVSFGGAMVSVDTSHLLSIADKYGSAFVAAPINDSLEARILLEANNYKEHEIKSLKGPFHVYLSIVKLKNTNVYYMITNPALVQCVGHIEIEEDIWIEQIKGVIDTVKDSIFSMSVDSPVVNGNIITDGLFSIDMLKHSIIQPEDKEEFLDQLDLKIEFPNSIPNSKGFKPKGDTYLKITVENELLGRFINKKEELSWEYMVKIMK